MKSETLHQGVVVIVHPCEARDKILPVSGGAEWVYDYEIRSDCANQYESGMPNVTVIVLMFTWKLETLQNKIKLGKKYFSVFFF